LLLLFVLVVLLATTVAASTKRPWRLCDPREFEKSFWPSVAIDVENISVTPSGRALTAGESVSVTFKGRVRSGTVTKAQLHAVLLRGNGFAIKEMDFDLCKDKSPCRIEQGQVVEGTLVDKVPNRIIPGAFTIRGTLMLNGQSIECIEIPLQLKA
jgi:hypothetical protein